MEQIPNASLPFAALISHFHDKKGMRICETPTLDDTPDFNCLIEMKEGG
jgi:hypothetical protein